MDIIKKMHFLWKVLGRSLSIEEFSHLLNLSELSRYATKPTADTKAAAWLLKLYFKRPLRQEEMDVLVNPSHDISQELWLKAVRKRKMSDVEQDSLVRHMPWYSMRRFPAELSDDYLSVLFAERNPQKIISYCSGFALPEHFEKLLIEKYRNSLSEPDEKMKYRKFKGMADGWRDALFAYLESSYCQGKRFVSKDVQMQLLALEDEEVLEKLISRCSIIENCLHEDVMWALVEQNKVDAMRLLLRESYLSGSSALMNFFEEKMPQLQPQEFIAQHRRNLYLMEQKNKIFIGALTFKTHENRLLLKHRLTAPDDMEDFVSTYIEPMMNTFGPCMCAYVAYHFPKLAHKALKRLQ